MAYLIGEEKPPKKKKYLQLQLSKKNQRQLFLTWNNKLKK